MRTKVIARLSLKRLSRVLAIAGAVALAVSACSSGTQQSGASGGSSAKLTGSTITVGYLTALTGYNANATETTPAVANAWVAWKNANGGVQGHPVRTITLDTQGSPATAEAEAQKLVSSDHVAAIILQDPASDGAVAPYLQQHNIPVVGGLAFNASVWGVLPNFFTDATSPTQTATSFVPSASAAKSTRMVDAACAENAYCLDSVPALQQLAKSSGVDYIGTLKISQSAPDYTAQCLEIQNEHANYVALALTSAVIQRLASDCLRQGYTGEFGAAAGSFVIPSLKTISGAHFAGGIDSFPWWANAPAANQYRAVMAKYAPSADYESPWHSAVWTSLQLIAAALGNDKLTPKTALTPEDVLNGLYALRDVTLGGLLPQPMTYTKGKPAPTVNCFWLYSYTAGDESPASETDGPSGNGQTGGLRSTCLSK